MTFRDIIDQHQTSEDAEERLDNIFYDLLPKKHDGLEDQKGPDSESKDTVPGPDQIDYEKIGTALGDTLFGFMTSTKSAKDQITEMGSEALARWLLNAGPRTLSSPAMKNPVCQVALNMALNSKLTPQLMDLVTGIVTSAKKAV